ncbi:hypothetical protein ONZ43_g7198 [Nemania bipapillata]|uniref:Uncharacterized protein n=1 Tax=Nemania bipapillata TaxID=110536 RepID=A0ACC2HTC3_9PEZI|nr:hypothetical protein ONZ43_g7198 [Nemania bipapillata]
MLAITTGESLSVIKHKDINMASPQPLAPVEWTKGGAVIEHCDDTRDDPKRDIEQPDRFGAYAKVDPKEIALVKKLDLYMMPVLWLMYFLNFLDRNAIVNGKLNHIDKDLGLVGSQYNTCVSIFFVGYITGQVPSNMLVTRLRPSWYLSGWMLAWAIVSTLNCLVKDYHGLLAVR